MTFQSGRDESLAILKSTGMWRSNYGPPYLRALWRMGVETVPPHFAPAYETVFLAGSWFGLAWGVMMWLGLWSNEGIPAMSALGTSCGAGLVFGLSMGAYYAYGRRRYNLPKWESLGRKQTTQA